MVYCAMLLRRAGIMALQLAVHMGETIPTAKPAPRLQHSPSQKLATELASRPDGFAVMELADALGGRSRSTAYTHVQRLEINGVIFPATHPSNMHVMRWFSSADAAAAWVQRQQGKPSPVVRAKVGKPGAELVVRGGTSSPPSTAKPALRGEVVIPDGVRITVAPTPAPRYGVAADAVLTGGFSTSRQGINPLTGEAW